MKVKCEKCGYEWEYKGQLKTPTCPSCLFKTKIKEDQTEQ